LVVYTNSVILKYLLVAIPISLILENNFYATLMLAIIVFPPYFGLMEPQLATPATPVHEPPLSRRNLHLNIFSGFWSHPSKAHCSFLPQAVIKRWKVNPPRGKEK